MEETIIMYSLVGIDGNVFSVMGYVTKAMKQCDFNKQSVDKYLSECMQSDCYSKIIVISLEYLNRCNEIKGSLNKSR